MKILAKIVLTILFIPIFLILLISLNLRFQLLNQGFWQGTFAANNVYSRLSSLIKNYADEQVTSEGGNKNDIKVLTDLVTPDNLKDLIDRNIANVLTFANGKAKEVLVYLPIGKLPGDFVPMTSGKISEITPLSVLLEEFNVQGVPMTQIQNLSRLGLAGGIIFSSALILGTVIILSLFLLVDPGRRLVSPGIALVLAGIFALLLVWIGTILRVNWAGSLTAASSINNRILVTVVPPILGNLLSLWMWLALALIVIGVMLFFVRKPRYNSPK